MKLQWITVTFICISLSAVSQLTFNTKKGPYEPLGNPISLNNDEVWTNVTNYQIYFNFDFKIHEQTYTALNVIAGGGLHFPGLGEDRLFVFHSPFGGWLLENRGTQSSESSIDYEITGNEGSRILKVQWTNAGFRQANPEDDPSDYTNFQIWLYEGSNKIEVRFGKSQTSDKTYGATGTSFKFWFETCDNVFTLTGPANLPSYKFYDICNPAYSFVEGTPDEGIIYVINQDSNWSPPTSLPNMEQNSSIKIYQNPAKDFVFVKGLPDGFQSKSIAVMDILGKAYTITLNSSYSNQITLETQNLPGGIYSLHIKGTDNKLYKGVFYKE